MIEELSPQSFEETFRLNKVLVNHTSTTLAQYFDLRENTQHFGYAFNCFETEHYLLALNLIERVQSSLNLPKLHFAASWDDEFGVCSIVVRNIMAAPHGVEETFQISLLKSASIILKERIIHNALSRNFIFSFRTTAIPIGFGADPQITNSNESISEKLNRDAYSYAKILMNCREFRVISEEIFGGNAQNILAGKFDNRANYLELFEYEP